MNFDTIKFDMAVNKSGETVHSVSKDNTSSHAINMTIQKDGSLLKDIARNFSINKNIEIDSEL